MLSVVSGFNGSIGLFMAANLQQKSGYTRPPITPIGVLMKPSAKKHPVAILRTIIGLTQRDLAEEIDLPTSTLQKIELRKFSLNPREANKLSHVTGVSREWLMAGDPRAPILDRRGRPFTRTFYDTVKAENERRKVSIGDSLFIRTASIILTVHVSAIMLKACRQNRSDLCFMELSSALKEVEQKFPRDRQFFEQLAGSAPHYGKLTDSLREIGFAFELEFNQHSLRENQRLLQKMTPEEKRRTVNTFKRLMHRARR